MKRHFKPRIPQAFGRHTAETVGSDTIKWDTPAADDGIPGHAGCDQLQLYGGQQSHHLYGQGVKSDAEMSSTFQDYLRDVGIPTALMTDGARAETGFDVTNICRHHGIQQFRSEPDYQNQNFIERYVQEVKSIVIALMNTMNTPPEYWLLCCCLLSL